MAYFTGRDVTVWITTEHEEDGIRLDGTAQTNQLITYPSSTSSTNDPNSIFSGLDSAGETEWILPNITGVDVSIGAQDEDISFMGLRNVGKIEVKKDTSVTITKKKDNVYFSMLFQGQTKANNSNGDGKHGGRYGLISKSDKSVMLISDGTTDPKTTTDDQSTAKQCFGYRVYLELKPESSTGAGDGEVLVIPNCMFSEYGHTLSNETANEETFTLTSQVKPFIYNGEKGSGVYLGKAIDQTATSLM